MGNFGGVAALVARVIASNGMPSLAGHVGAAPVQPLTASGGDVPMKGE